MRTNMRTLTLALILNALAVGCAGPRAVSQAGPETRPALLAALDGKWIVAGDVLAKPVKYSLNVSPVLAGTFTELHMIDVQQPPQYEARVFIGHDKESEQIIVHWLDVFGAKGSIPHGTGQIMGNTIEFIIPYPEGPFRDRFTWNATGSTWRFTIESSDGTGGWKHFATYDITRSE